jgi:hypothetical protein
LIYDDEWLSIRVSFPNVRRRRRKEKQRQQTWINVYTWVQRNSIILRAFNFEIIYKTVRQEEHTKKNMERNKLYNFKRIDWKQKKLNLRQPGVEPGSAAWKATMITATPLTLDILNRQFIALPFCYFWLKWTEKPQVTMKTNILTSNVALYPKRRIIDWKFWKISPPWTISDPVCSWTLTYEWKMVLWSNQVLTDRWSVGKRVSPLVLTPYFTNTRFC